MKKFLLVFLCVISPFARVAVGRSAQSTPSATRAAIARGEVKEALSALKTQASQEETKGDWAKARAPTIWPRKRPATAGSYKRPSRMEPKPSSWRAKGKPSACRRGLSHISSTLTEPSGSTPRQRNGSIRGSALLLAGVGKDDGRLKVGEVFSLNLNADMVVLSACETGLGKLSNGDELVGLTRAFIYAGTPSIVTTLWKVNDRASYELMKEFYTNLKTTKKSEALRQAQLTTMKEFPEPFYWAAYQLTGEP
jgi:CHAT domain-containing protein